MQNISNVIDAVNGVSAGEFKEVCGEEENLILSSGQVLNQSDLLQIAKAVSVYAGRGDAYTVLGTANSLTLAPNGSMLYPPSYHVGLRVRFRPGVINTSTSVNLRISTLDYAPVSAYSLTGAQSPVMPSNFFNTNKWYTAVYAYNGTVYYWKLENILEQDDFTGYSVPAGALDNDAVTTNTIATSAVTTTRIANGAVNSDKLGTNSVITSKILDANVTFEKLEDDIVDVRETIVISTVTFTQSPDFPWAYFATGLSLSTTVPYVSTSSPPIQRMCTVTQRDATNPSAIKWRTCPATVSFGDGGGGNCQVESIYVFGPLIGAASSSFERLNIYYKG